MPATSTSSNILRSCDSSNPNKTTTPYAKKTASPKESGSNGGGERRVGGGKGDTGGCTVAVSMSMNVPTAAGEVDGVNASVAEGAEKYAPSSAVSSASETGGITYSTEGVGIVVGAAEERTLMPGP